MQHTIRVTDDSVEVSVQRDLYTNAIGSSTPVGFIDDIITFSEDAKTPDWYSGHEDWYEMPEKEGLDQKVAAIANMWLEVRRSSTVLCGHHVDTSARTKTTSSEPQSTSEDMLLLSTDHC